MAQAPGRLHYMGGRWEKNGGYYLSSAIDRYAWVAVSGRKDNSLRFYAKRLRERKRTTILNLKYKREDRWANYVKLSIYLFMSLGCDIHGLDITIDGDIPMKITLGSSSAIELAAAFALRKFCKVEMSDAELLKKLCEARNVFYDKDDTNIVDYLIGMNAADDRFLIVDEKGQSITPVPSPFSGYEVLIIDSKVSPLDVGEDFKKLRSELKEGGKLLLKFYHWPSFRDYKAEELAGELIDLPESVRRRCLHVVSEYARITEMEAELKNADFAGIARVFRHSHESLRDLLEISCPEVDWLVKRSLETPGCAGARMTGRGFGGCVFSFQKAEGAKIMVKEKLDDYERTFGYHPLYHEVRLGRGARVLEAEGGNEHTGKQ
jgi:galactokinase